MAHYRNRRNANSYAPSHYASGSNHPSFGVTYDPDNGFAAVDPFKPSVAYSIQNIWAPETSNAKDLYTPPPTRRPSTQAPYPPSQHPLPQPPSQPVVIIPEPYERRRHSPQPTIIVPPSVHVPRSRSSSPSCSRIDRRRRDESRSRSPSRSRRPPPVSQPIIIRPPPPRSRSPSHRRRRGRSPSHSLRSLSLVHGLHGPIQEYVRRAHSRTPSSSRDRSESPRKKVRVYTARRRSSSPVVIQGPQPTSWPHTVTQPVLPSNVLYVTPPSSTQSKYESTKPSYHQYGRREGFPLRAYVLAFIFDTLPRQLYLHFLLRLPGLYFSRVSRVFEEADMSMPKIKQGILEAAAHKKDYPSSTLWFELPTVQFGNLEIAWQYFIDTLLQEWQTLNIISALLLSAILAIMNISDAANDPLTRYAALTSMICAFMSIIYGCIFIIRFGTMRKTYKAAEWAQESKQSRTSIFWNVWILLAMPAIWLAWSLISFLVCMISFVWRAGTPQDSVDRRLSRDQALIPRIVSSCVFVIGFIYFILIVSTLRRYGAMMDLAWEARIRNWIDDSRYSRSYPRNSSRSDIYPPSTAYAPTVVYPASTGRYPYPPHYNSTSIPPPPPVPPMPVYVPPCYSPGPQHVVPPTLISSVEPTVVIPPPVSPPRPLSSSRSSLNDVPQSREASLARGRRPDIKTSFSRLASSSRDEGVTNAEQTKIRMTKLVDLITSSGKKGHYSPTDEDLAACQISREKWKEMNEGVLKSWDPGRLETLHESLDRWNAFFNERGTQIGLCQESRDSLLQYAIYNFDTIDRLSQPSLLISMPTGVQKLVILPVDELRMHRGPWNGNIVGITLFSDMND